MAYHGADWPVLGNEPIQQLSENLWRVVGTLPKMALKRQMVVAKLGDGTLLVHNAIAMGAAEMARLDAWGEVSVIVVPNGWHRIDCARFKQRYPRSLVLCPRGARRQVAKRVGVGASYDEWPGDERVKLAHLVGTKEREGVLSVRSADGLTLVFNDALFNQPHLPGVHGWIMKAIGSSGGPRITGLARLLMVKDRAALRAQLEGLAQQGPVRLVPGHGELIDSDASAVLAAIAASLERRVWR